MPVVSPVVTGWSNETADEALRREVVHLLRLRALEQANRRSRTSVRSNSTRAQVAR